ncbi:energy-coupling factor transporter transmembrane component T family protein [Paenibacillus shenyangensis]|uniref:energy-coupling factor transporter transmembrane component T family protein n=1 Tax=Paenibacillus sp. A9 TaxID=1284352 RepID=UPI000370ECA3|nr:energy-coupling factor transporter transmembrane component T [Paenibacillus sp. A9]
MSTQMLSYTNLNTPIHRLTGVTKLIFFILWALTAMIIYDTRCLLVMLVLSLVIFRMSRVPFQQYSFVLYLILVFFAINQVAIFLFSPLYGVELYGSQHDIVHITGRYTLTWEQLFYQFNVALKYAVVIPIALLFLLVTDPSEFASSLNRIGVSYKIAYSVAIALRYIPDVQQDFQNIAFSAQARGIDISRKEKLGKRLKNVVSILMPLILTSVDRIEKISTAMELRGFGRKNKRTWYKSRPFQKGDYMALTLVIVVAVVSFAVTFADGSRFYNIFQ